jgi:hypothetical protein
MSASRTAPSVLLLAALAVTAGAVHAVVSVEHFHEHWAFGAFFVVTAVAQIAWGIRVWSHPTSKLLVAGAAGTAGIVAVWAWSRTVGIPLGHEHGGAEAVGLVDAVTTLAEVATIALVLAVIRVRAPRVVSVDGARV